jgi:hypothetical protein
MKLLIVPAALGVSVLAIALATFALPSSATAQECHSSYEGDCLDPTLSDYDCIGGTGDGPGYAYQVSVVGDDPFELDDDGDGVGCESSPVRPASPAPEAEQQPAPDSGAEAEVADVAKAPSAGFGPVPGRFRANSTSW